MTNTNSHVHCDHCNDVSERCPECGATENGKCRHGQNDEINRLRGLLKEAATLVCEEMFAPHRVGGGGYFSGLGEPLTRRFRALSAKLAKELDQ